MLPSSHRPVPHRTSVFTLIELLVVVAIIGVLAAMLLPALGKAKAASQRTSCSGNFKQVSAGLLMYTDEADDWLPITVWEWPAAGGSWQWQARKYIGVNATNDSKMVRCPAMASTGVNGLYDLSVTTMSMVTYMDQFGNTQGPTDLRYGNRYSYNAGRLANLYPASVGSYQAAPQLRDYIRPDTTLLLYEYYYTEVWKGMNGTVWTELRDSRGIGGALGGWHSQLGYMNGAFADGHVENLYMPSTYASMNFFGGTHYQARGKYFSLTGQ